MKKEMNLIDIVLDAVATSKSYIVELNDCDGYYETITFPIKEDAIRHAQTQSEDKHWMIIKVVEKIYIQREIEWS